MADKPPKKPSLLSRILREMPYFGPPGTETEAERSKHLADALRRVAAQEEGDLPPPVSPISPPKSRYWLDQRAALRSRPPMPPPPPSSGEPPPAAESGMGLNEAVFWIFLTVFGTGLYLVSDQHLWGALLVVIGALGLVYSLRRHLPPTPHRTWIVVVTMLISAAVMGYDIYLREKTTVQSTNLGRSAAVIDHLQEMYAAVTQVMDIGENIPTVQNGGGFDKKATEDFKGAALKWEATTDQWLKDNLGPAGPSKLHEVNTVPFYEWKDGGEIDIILNRLNREKNNLGILIQTSAFDRK